MAKRNIPVDLFYASYNSDCTYELNSRKKKYGDMELADAKRLKALEKENAELKKMLAESMLENRVLKEVNEKVTMFKGIEPHC